MGRLLQRFGDPNGSAKDKKMVLWDFGKSSMCLVLTAKHCFDLGALALELVKSQIS